MGFVPNDVIDTLYGLDAVKVHPSGYLILRHTASPGAVGRFLFMHSHLCRIVLSKAIDWRNSRRENWPAVYRENGVHEPHWRKIEDEFAKMASIAGSVGARMHILHIPQRGPWAPARDYPARRLAAWADDHGVGFMDALPALRAAEEANPEAPLYWPQDGHCTPAGYAAIAKELALYLNDNQWVP